jgi:hypothetical protein
VKKFEQKMRKKSQKITKKNQKRIKKIEKYGTIHHLHVKTGTVHCASKLIR